MCFGRDYRCDLVLGVGVSEEGRVRFFFEFGYGR